MTTPELPPVTEPSLPNATEKKMDWGFWVWWGCSLMLTLVATVVGTAWAVKHVSNGGTRLSTTQSSFVLWLADSRLLIRDGIAEILIRFSPNYSAHLLAREEVEKPQWKRHFPEPMDTGYLLLSGMDPATNGTSVSLIRVADGTTLARWIPDWSKIHAKTTPKKFVPVVTPLHSRMMHPILLSNGDIIVNNSSSMARFSICSKEPVWVLDEPMHHSNELDSNGDIWGPSVMLYNVNEHGHLSENFRDDALARVSKDGHLLEKRSFMDILRANNLQVLIFGINYSINNRDPIHINQIQPAMQDGQYWKKDDLLISSSALSTVFLYRPSTNKIIWHRTGPWIHQHSVNFVNDRKISIFDNNNFEHVSGTKFISASKSNNVYFYDFETDILSQPFAQQLAKEKPVTISEGRAQVLADGGLFIEETNFGRHLRFTKDDLLWSRINDYDSKRIGMVSWSRYLTGDEVREAIKSINSKNCQ